MDRPQFSETLSSRRRQLGFSTAQATRVLRLKEDVLIAFEEGNFEAMPKSGYAQGMLSSYARYLGLDAAQIVEMYADELEHWRREVARKPGGPHYGATAGGQRSGGVGQPYVASRGLLPTSGGPAGDMGSFATTRVRTRRQEPYDGYERDDDTSAYADGPSQGYHTSSHPYTNRAPARRVRSGGTRYYDDIQTRGVRARDYEDDLRIGMDARSYEAASTQRGRRASRSTSSSGRQRVRRRPDGRSGARGRSGSSSRRRNQQMSSGLLQSPMQAFAVIGVAIAVISVVLVLSISSCINSNFNATRTVPVSTATSTNDGQATSKDATSGSEAIDAGSDVDIDTATRESTTSQRNAQTSVSISVADGAVTWLEIDCDGTSEVAETVTGPWQNTYVVEDSLTVQAGDTTAVSVIQNGRQVQFDSMASGIGTIRIQGTKSNTKSTRANDDEENTSEGDQGDDAAPSERMRNSTSSSGTSSARIGNNAQTEGESDEDNSREETDREYDDANDNTY